MLITPTLMMQILPQLVPQLSQVTGMLIGGKKGRDIATKGALLGQVLGLADLGKSFLSPKIGDELKKSQTGRKECQKTLVQKETLVEYQKESLMEYQKETLVEYQKESLVKYQKESPLYQMTSHHP